VEVKNLGFGFFRRRVRKRGSSVKGWLVPGYMQATEIERTREEGLAGFK
jgi:hypothetical protein